MIIPAVVQPASLGIEANAVSLILTMYNAIVYIILAVLFFVAGKDPHFKFIFPLQRKKFKKSEHIKESRLKHE